MLCHSVYTCEVFRLYVHVLDELVGISKMFVSATVTVKKRPIPNWKIIPDESMQLVSLFPLYESSAHPEKKTVWTMKRPLATTYQPTIKEDRARINPDQSRHLIGRYFIIFILKSSQKLK